ncbi:MAG: hypothetical protein II186_07625 [Erysipelotrichales bacterium]|nr:hypothetical protein [Erysipelotrichales bacterium]
MNRFNKFSVPLGLLDYVNPICYTVTMTVLVKYLFPVMGAPWNILFLAGAVLSVVFGFVIPTGKVLVGLGIVKFRMPVSLVFTVNSGILVSGLMLFRHVFRLPLFFFFGLVFLIIAALSFLYSRKKKVNTVAVLTGACGYLLLYISLITLSVQSGYILPVFLYGIAILLFVFLCGVGIKANLYDPKVHWIIEICNVICQFLVALSTVLLFIR